MEAHVEDVDTVEYFSGNGAASDACRSAGDVVVSFDRDHGRHMDLTSCSGFAWGRSNMLRLCDCMCGAETSCNLGRAIMVAVRVCVVSADVFVVGRWSLALCTLLLKLWRVGE